jgi:DNA-binding NtrC family response regulator
VDDDPNVLEGLKVHLSRNWEVTTATSGEAALELLAQQGFAVVISDMRMPGMDGAALLRTIGQRYPETVRILLTGHRASIGGGRRETPEVDDGIFRVLTKPCPPHVLVAAVEAAVQQYNRTVGE